MFHRLYKGTDFMMMKTLKNTLAALISVSIFFACETEDVSPINPSMPRLSTGVPDEGDREFREYIEEFDRVWSESDGGTN
jgi:hypothetical protein